MSLPVLKKKDALTVIELLIALMLSSLVSAVLYRALISQQRTYTVQDQVAEMQQNARAAIGRMTNEIRMAGSGGDLLAVFGSINGFTDIITPASDSITIILAEEVGALKQNAGKGATQVKVTNAKIFNADKKKYLCLSGLNNYSVRSVTEDTIDLTAPLAEGHPVNQPVYLIKAISYYLGLSNGKPVLRRNENTGGGGQPLADNIESLEFTYYDVNGNVTEAPADIRMVKVTVIAKTNVADSEYRGGDGYRRRVLSSSIKVRNMGLRVIWPTGGKN